MSYDLKIKDGDLTLSNTNDLAVVENSEKLTQDILKIILTPINSNPFFPWYGSPITRSLIGTSFDETFVSQVATSQLQNSLETLQNLQKEQLRIQPQLITPQEQIAATQNVSVIRNTVDPRFFQVSVIVLSKAFRRVSSTIGIHL